MQGGANDNSRGDEPSELARPTISDVLAAYLADEKGRLAARTHGRYADVIDLLQHSLNSYGPNTLDKDEYELWERCANDAPMTAATIPASSATYSDRNTSCPTSGSFWAIS